MQRPDGNISAAEALNLSVPAGGLLACVPADAASACLDELHELGYPHATIIGRGEPRTTEAAPIQVIG